MQFAISNLINNFQNRKRKQESVKPAKVAKVETVAPVPAAAPGPTPAACVFSGALPPPLFSAVSEEVKAYETPVLTINVNLCTCRNAV